jgi:hypothetical protein
MKILKHMNRKLIEKSKSIKTQKSKFVYKKCQCVHAGCNEEKTVMEVMSEELYMVMD